MALQGNLESFFLSSIFQLLNNDKKTGALYLKRGDREVQVILEEGNIIYAMSTNKEARLGTLLISKGAISLEQLETCLNEGKQKKQALGKILVDKGYISIDQLKRFIQKQVEEIVYELFLWDAGDFSYKDAKFDLSGMVVTYLDLTKIILEAARRIDEMSVIKKQIPNNRLIFDRTRKGTSVETNKLAGSEAVIMNLIDGRRTVDDLVEAGELGKFATYKILYSLISSGLIEKIDTPVEGLSSQPNKAPSSPHVSTTSEPTSSPKPVQSDVPTQSPHPPQTLPPQPLLTGTTEEENYAAIITVYHNILYAIWRTLQPEIGQESLVLFNDCKPETLPGQIDLFRDFHPGNSAPANILRLEKNLRLLENLKNERLFLIESFNRFVLNLMNRIPDILGTLPTQKVLEEIEQVLPDLDKYMSSISIKTNIVDDIKKIMDRVAMQIVDKDKKKDKQSSLLSLFSKK